MDRIFNIDDDDDRQAPTSTIPRASGAEDERLTVLPTCLCTPALMHAGDATCRYRIIQEPSTYWKPFIQLHLSTYAFL